MIRSNATETLPMRIPSIGGSIGQRYMFTHMQYLGSNFVSGLKLKQHFIMKLCCCVNQVARTNLFISMNKIQSTLMTQNQSILRLFPIALAWKNSLKSMNKVQSTLITSQSINCHTLSNSFNVTISTLDVKAALLFK